jgi:hypothetical protein
MFGNALMVHRMFKRKGMSGRHEATSAWINNKMIQATGAVYSPLITDESKNATEKMRPPQTNHRMPK